MACVNLWLMVFRHLPRVPHYSVVVNIMKFYRHDQDSNPDRCGENQTCYPLHHSPIMHDITSLFQHCRFQRESMDMQFLFPKKCCKFEAVFYFLFFLMYIRWLIIKFVNMLLLLLLLLLLLWSC